MRHNTLTTVAILLSVLSLSACKSNSTLELENNTPWTLSKINGKSVAQYGAYISLENERLQGFTGCNSFFGTLERSEVLLRIQNVGTTRKLCHGEEAKLDQQLPDILSQWNTVKLQSQTLILKNDNNTLEFIKK